MARRGREVVLGWVGVAGADPLLVLGMASIASADAPLDSLDPARIVRRALADAGVKATEVSHLIITATSEGDADGDGDGATFARRALGPHGETVEVLVRRESAVLTAAAEGDASGLTIALLTTGPALLALCLRSGGDPQSIVK